MSLTDAYTVAVGRIPDLFAKIKDGQAPDVFTVQLLKDWGFTSSRPRSDSVIEGAGISYA